mgnify:CR=1 FL=1
MKRRLLIAITLLLIFTTYKPQSLFSITKFNIQEIIIENNSILEDFKIKKDLINIYNKNLIFLSTLDIKEILKKNTFIDSFVVKKIYPNSIKIKIFEKKPIAIIQYKKKKFYISENIDLIEYQDLENFVNLPVIFGDEKNFEILFNELKKINFPFEIIKTFYFFETKRWDLETHKGKTIKLPVKNYKKSLESFLILKEKNNFKKYKIFDYRIKNQLILK